MLTVIERNPGLTQTQVAAALGIKRTNFVGMLDELEKRALAERRQTARDKRSYALYLTRRRRHADAQAAPGAQGAREPHDRARSARRAATSSIALLHDDRGCRRDTRAAQRREAQGSESFAITSAGIG